MHSISHHGRDMTTTTKTMTDGADLWVKEQLFEEDVRAVLQMMRPHGRERLMGWTEYRTGGSHFRVTVSWDNQFGRDAKREPLVVPNMTDVLETLLVGSSKESGDLTPAEEFARYREVVRELYKRIDDMEACYT